LNLSGFIPRGLPRLPSFRPRFKCGINSSRNPEKWTGFRVKHGMTFDTSLLAAGWFISS
jgi:hypothetical protein